MVLFKILYSGKLLKEKTFVNFVVFAKVFSTKFGGVVPFGTAIHDSSLPQMFPAIV